MITIPPTHPQHCWPVSGPTFVHCFPEIFGSLKGVASESDAAFRLMRGWHESVGQHETMASCGFTKAQIPELARAVRECPGMNGLLALSPVPVTDADIQKFFLEGFFDTK